MAGADPVGTAIRANILYTVTNPNTYNRLMAEFSAHGLLLSSNASLTDSLSYDTLRKLPYLSAVIKESFRIHPPYVGLLEKTVPEGGDYLPDGRFLPAGTMIGSNIWAIQRDRAVFGDDAETFRPERWLECENPEQRASMERTVELCFSSGRYTCLGKEVAIMEISKTVAEVCNQFAFAFAQD